MSKTIFYVDLTPCDDMHNYQKAVCMPNFIKKDTPHFDDEFPAVVQVATKFGWCIVAKWVNNGSTRIYACDERTLKEGVDILTGVCDSVGCDYAVGDRTFHCTTISEEDCRVFRAWDVFDAMAEECMQTKKETQTTKVYVIDANYNEEEKHYESVRIPAPFSVTILVSNTEEFARRFDGDTLRHMILQGLRDEVMSEYNSRNTFPKHAMAPYKFDGHAIFSFNRLERDEWDEHLIAYYDFETAVS